MTQTVESWLPISVAARDVVEAAIGRAVTDWSALWFAHPYVDVSSVRPTLGEHCEDSDGDGWRVHRGSIAISCSKRASSRVAGWALDAQLGELSLRKSDRRLLEVFERKLIEDLVRKLELAFGIAGEFRPQAPALRNPLGRLGGVIVDLTDQYGGVVLSLAIPLQDVLPMCRASLGATDGARAPLASFANALGSADLAIEATLGTAEVPMADLRNLAPGDILVLQRGLGECMDICLPGSENAFARAKLIDLDGQMALALQA